LERRRRYRRNSPPRRPDTAATLAKPLLDEVDAPFAKLPPMSAAF
jgi:hypothetical protein